MVNWDFMGGAVCLLGWQCLIRGGGFAAEIWRRPILAGPVATSHQQGTPMAPWREKAVIQLSNLLPGVPGKQP